MPAVSAHVSLVCSFCRYTVVLWAVLGKECVYLRSLSGVHAWYLLVQRAFAAP